MNIVKSCFSSISYKQGFIFSNYWKSEITGKSGEEFSFCPRDGVGSFPCKSIHAAKILITKYNKVNHEH